MKEVGYIRRVSDTQDPYVIARIMANDESRFCDHVEQPNDDSLGEDKVELIRLEYKKKREATFSDHCLEVLIVCPTCANTVKIVDAMDDDVFNIDPGVDRDFKSLLELNYGADAADKIIKILVREKQVRKIGPSFRTYGDNSVHTQMIDNGHNKAIAEVMKP